MPEIRDREAIRALLRADAGWSAFAVGDLAPPYWERCSWHGAGPGEQGMVMVYRGFHPPVLFAMGNAGALLDEIAEDRVYLHVPESMLTAVQARYREVQPKAMWRMVLDPARYRPECRGHVERLDASAVESLQRLYADGEAWGEAPGFFQPEMLEDGAFFGIREGAGWVAAAGTQLVVPAEGVAAVGNVYTRRDRRGHGLAGAVTSAVVDEVLRRGIATIALNVSQGNTAAVRVYERLGFIRHCAYWEGVAIR